MRIRRLLRDGPPEEREKLGHLERGLPNNVTIDMGLAMDRLARFEEIRELESGEEFAARLRTRELSPEFLRTWDAFMQEYGFRCPMEMDPAAPRPYEQPAVFFEQLRAMSGMGQETDDPHRAYERVKAERERAYQDLGEIALRKGPGKARQFKKNYEALVALAGLRETPKYCAIVVTDMFRRRVLEAGRLLVEAGRLDQVDQVFDLTMADLDQAFSDPSFDLRERAHINTRFYKRLGCVREFPRLIDSRGKILRPPREPAAEGELRGEPISTGVVCGPAKVLHTPDEKPILAGDILVAQATDPGWAPLFINAAAVVLEVGGLLQHGALVAREYGKPCVAGIEGVTALLKDGQMVEVDGTHGVVRMV